MTIGSTGATPSVVASGRAGGAAARGGEGKQAATGSVSAPRAVVRDAVAAGEHAAAVERAAEYAVKPVPLPEFRRYELAFRLDKELNRVVVQVIDGETGTVLRTIPPEDLARALKQLNAPPGVLVDQES
jgi:hypothetical protein